MSGLVIGSALQMETQIGDMDWRGGPNASSHGTAGASAVFLRHVESKGPLDTDC